MTKTTTAASMVPDAPTGTKMSKKGKNLIFLIFLALTAFILWAIFGLSPKTQTTNGPQDSLTINKNQLGNQQQQSQDLVNSLRVQAYGVAAGSSNQGPAASIVSGAIPQPMNTGSNNVVPPASMLGQPQLTNNLQTAPGASPNTVAMNNTMYSGAQTGGYAVSGGGMTTQQQILQSGMQSSLTPSGFNSMGSNNSSNGNTAANNYPANNSNAQSGESALANAITQASSSMGGAGDQNMQNEKSAFLQNQNANNDSLSAGVQTPVSNYMVMAGSVIPATFLTGINSDLPGQIQAIVSQNVYDSKTGNNILIPQGSRLIGTYDSQVAYGQSRVLMVWTRIIFPDQQYIDLQGMPGADLTGAAGITDEVDNHYFKIYGSALLMSIFSAGMQLSQPESNNANGAPNTQQILAAALGQNMGQLATQMAQKNLNIQPTIKIRSGNEFDVLVTRDIPFSQPYSDDEQSQILLPKTN